MLIKKHFARLYRIDEPGDDGGGEAVGTGNDARVAFLNQIADANDADRKDELASVNDDGTTSEFELDDATRQELARAEEEANQEDPEEKQAEEKPLEPVQEHPQAKTYKLKVNGVEREFTEEQMVERARKVEAADEYLREAARLKREAEQLNTREVPPRESGRTEADLLEERRALVRAIQMGDEEEAMAALEKLQQPQRPALNAEELARTVDERLTFNDAINRFKSEYADVLSDPVLRNLALSTDQSLVAKGDKRGYWERYKAIGDDIRAWRSGLVKPAAEEQPAAPDQSADRQQRKAAAPQPPKPANSRAPAAAREDEGEEDPREVIANIAKARGGPQWMRA
jgi:hypothetical protein